MPGTRPGMTAAKLAQRLVEELLQLRLMLRHLADCGRGRRRAGRVARPPLLGLDLVEPPFAVVLDEVPRAHVARLLLAPYDLGLLEAGELGDQRLGRERIELLDAKNVD